MPRASGSAGPSTCSSATACRSCSASSSPTRRRGGQRRARGAARSCSAPTSRASSRRWTGSPSPSACSTRRCTSSSPTSRSCWCSDAQGSARRRRAQAARAAPQQWREANPMLGTRGVRLGIIKPGLYRMQVKAIARGRARAQARRRRSARRDHDPARRHRARAELVDDWVREVAARDLRRVRRRRGRLPRRHDGRDAARALDRRSDIAEVAEFFSFGTNDLTQMTFGFSRDDVEGRFMPSTSSSSSCRPTRSRPSTSRASASSCAMAVEARPRPRPDLKLGICGEHGGDPASVAFFARGRPRLRVVLAVPRAASPASPPPTPRSAPAGRRTHRVRRNRLTAPVPSLRR